MSKIFEADPRVIIEERFAADVDAVINYITVELLKAYKVLRRYFYADPRFRRPDETIDSEAAYAAFAKYTKLKNADGGSVTSDQLALMAMAVKVLINMFQPCTIVDDVPEAKIEFPDEYVEIEFQGKQQA